MASSRPDPTPFANFLPVLVANLVPLAGVLWLGWSAATLVVIYVFELLASAVIAGGKALFAQQSPADPAEKLETTIEEAPLLEKRGTITIRGLPPVHLRNIPFATSVAPLVLFVLLCSILVLFLSGGIAREGQPTGEVAVPIVILVGSHLVETWREYFDTGQYRETTPAAVIEPAKRDVSTFFFFLLILYMVQSLGGTTPILGGLVLFKIVLEWSAFRADHGGSDRLTGVVNWLSEFVHGDAPDTGTEALASAPTVPEGEPDARFETSRIAAAYTALAWTSKGYAVLMTLWVPFVLGLTLGGLVAAFDPELPPIAGSVLLLSVFWISLVVIGFRAVRRYLALGPVEYRQYGDRVVAYDTWVDTPQWSAGTIRDVEVEPRWIPDLAFGTRRMTLRTGVGEDETERTIGPLGDPAGFCDAFDLPVVDPESEARGWRPVVASVVVPGTVCGLVGLAVLQDLGVLVAVLVGIYLFPACYGPSLGITRRVYRRFA
jgi:hypothetical protein